MSKHYQDYPKIRNVTVQDRIRLTNLLILFAKKSGNEKLRKLVPKISKIEDKNGKNSKDNKEKDSTDLIYEAIQNILEAMIVWIQDDVWAWYIELMPNINSIEEFKKLPFDIEVYIIEQLIKQEGFKNFFTKALKPVKWLQGFLDKLPF